MPPMTTVFPDPVLVAENAAAAAVRIDDALRRCGDTDPRHRLVYRPGDDGKPWFRDGRGGIWRCLVRVVGARPADPGIPAETRAAARLLGISRATLYERLDARQPRAA